VGDEPRRHRRRAFGDGVRFLVCRNRNRRNSPSRRADPVFLIGTVLLSRRQAKPDMPSGGGRFQAPLSNSLQSAIPISFLKGGRIPIIKGSNVTISHVDDADEYIDYAKRCLKMADRLTERESRLILREMAAEWIKLAGHAVEHNVAPRARAAGRAKAYG
jgi:hypothetical protein